MYQFKIQFAYSWSPWLLLLLIPAIAIPLFLHFRVAKRFRRTRNRIISLVLHLTTMVLTVAALAGITFAYQVDNPENEIILLVDVSDTQEACQERRDEFVSTVLNESSYDGFRVGIVTFGFTQEYAVPLTYEVEDIYEAYLAAPLPDTSATDIEAALRFTAGLFENPASSKIVLITDGKETDEHAISAVSEVTGKGIKLDTAYISSDYEDNFQVTGVEFPDYHVALNEEIDIRVNVRSKIDADGVKVELLDNGKAVEPRNAEGEEGNGGISAGSNAVEFRNTFTEEGLHEFRVRIVAEDGLQQNNEYYSYYYLELYDRVLILERYEGESEKLEELLSQEEGGYRVETRSVLTVEELFPKEEDMDPNEAFSAKVNVLRQYDQIILNNIANADFPAGFDEVLYSYVYDYGGGLFTVGGNDKLSEDPKPHAYDRNDMRNTLFQQMLPVQAIDYTPPLGVVIVVDISGSMDEDAGQGLTKRELAKQGAVNCLEALSERDYVGIMTLDTVYGVVLPMTSAVQKSAIVSAIDGIDGTGGTVFSQAISRAGQLLTDLKTVDRRHIVIVTDGMPNNSDEDNYLLETRQNFINNKITLSIVGVGIDPGSEAENKMKTLVSEDYGNGRYMRVTGKASDIAQDMYEDLTVPEIKEVIPEPFRPIVSDPFSPLLSGVEYGTDSENRRAMDVELGGFFGVKVRSEEYLVLQGEFEVPLYAQWKFGKGSVGSFMSDLSGVWSADFMADENGKRFLLNVVSNLMPTENIRPNEIVVDLDEDNYINRVNVFSGIDVGGGETLRGEIYDVSTGETVSLDTAPETENEFCYVKEFLERRTGYSMCAFVLKKQGVYRITFTAYDADGNVKAEYSEYKSFSFSEEYDAFAETEEDPAQMLAALAEQGGGAAVQDLEVPWEIFENFETKIGHVFDPRWLFMITAMVLFLLDIAVRKFKFKWPHELYREYKQKRERKNAVSAKISPSGNAAGAELKRSEP